MLIRSRVAWAIHPCHRVGLYRLNAGRARVLRRSEKPFRLFGPDTLPGASLRGDSIRQVWNVLVRWRESSKTETVCMLPLVLPTTLRLFRVGRLRLAPGRARVLRRSGKPFRLSGQGVRL